MGEPRAFSAVSRPSGLGPGGGTGKKTGGRFSWRPRGLRDWQSEKNLGRAGRALEGGPHLKKRNQYLFLAGEGGHDIRCNGGRKL